MGLLLSTAERFAASRRRGASPSRDVSECAASHLASRPRARPELGHSCVVSTPTLHYWDTVGAAVLRFDRAVPLFRRATTSRLSQRDAVASHPVETRRGLTPRIAMAIVGDWRRVPALRRGDPPSRPASWQPSYPTFPGQGNFPRGPVTASRSPPDDFSVTVLVVASERRRGSGASSRGRGEGRDLRPPGGTSCPRYFLGIPLQYLSSASRAPRGAATMFARFGLITELRRVHQYCRGHPYGPLAASRSRLSRRRDPLGGHSFGCDCRLHT